MPRPLEARNEPERGRRPSQPVPSLSLISVGRGGPIHTLTISPGWRLARMYGVGNANVRIDVTPKDEVYVDSYCVGVVDDYDGIFQHVTLRAGPHLEICRTG